MISYRGDKFIKSKKFKLGEKVIIFKSKSNKGYIFESDGRQVILPESKARLLKECKINE